MKIPKIEDCSKKEFYETLVHVSADNYRLEELLKSIGSAFSNEIVDKKNGNYLKIKVDDIPEQMLNYIE